MSPEFARDAASGFPISNGGIDLQAMLSDIERATVLHALKLTDWYINKAASLLGLSFRQMRYVIQKYDLAGNVRLSERRHTDEAGAEYDDGREPSDRR